MFLLAAFFILTTVVCYVSAMQAGITDDEYGFIDHNAYTIGDDRNDS